MSAPEVQNVDTPGPDKWIAITGVLAVMTVLTFILMAAGMTPYPFPAPYHHGICSPILAMELPTTTSDLCTTLGTNHPGKKGSLTQESCAIPAAKSFDSFSSGKAIALITANTWEDLIFIPLYALFIFSFARLLTKSAEGKVRTLGRAVGVLIIIAALFDYVEDHGIFSSLKAADLTDQLALNTRHPSLGKWTLIGICLLLLAVILFRASIPLYQRGFRIFLACLTAAAGLLMLIALFQPFLMIFANLLFGVFVLVNAVALLHAYAKQSSAKTGVTHAG